MMKKQGIKYCRRKKLQFQPKCGYVLLRRALKSQYKSPFMRKMQVGELMMADMHWQNSSRPPRAGPKEEYFKFLAGLEGRTLMLRVSIACRPKRSRHKSRDGSCLRSRGVS